MTMPGLSTTTCINFISENILHWEEANNKGHLVTQKWDPKQVIPVIALLLKYINISPQTPEETDAYRRLIERIQILNTQTQKIKSAAPSTVPITVSAPSTPTLNYLGNLSIVTSLSSISDLSTPPSETKDPHS